MRECPGAWHILPSSQLLRKGYTIIFTTHQWAAEAWDRTCFKSPLQINLDFSVKKPYVLFSLGVAQSHETLDKVHMLPTDVQDGTGQEMAF